MSINEKGIGWADIINFPGTTLSNPKIRRAHQGIVKPDLNSDKKTNFS